MHTRAGPMSSSSSRLTQVAGIYRDRRAQCSHLQPAASLDPCAHRPRESGRSLLRGRANTATLPADDTPGEYDGAYRLLPGQIDISLSLRYGDEMQVRNMAPISSAQNTEVKGSIICSLGQKCQHRGGVIHGPPCGLVHRTSEYFRCVWACWA